jgi:hypothetical protein
MSRLIIRAASTRQTPGSAQSERPGFRASCRREQSIDLVVAVTAPARSGRHVERYRLVGEGISWFEGPPIELRVLVV